MYFAVKRCVDELGRIVLPKDLRSHYGIQTGDVLEVTPTEGGILLKLPLAAGGKENENRGIW